MLAERSALERNDAMKDEATSSTMKEFPGSPGSSSASTEPSGPPVLPFPPPPEERARAVASSFASAAKLSSEDEKRLQGLIVEAMSERLLEMQDIRLGRVLGSALATL
jgi:hypothetical protein